MRPTSVTTEVVDVVAMRGKDEDMKKDECVRRTAYITKWCLTKGILEAEGEEDLPYFYFGRYHNQACKGEWSYNLDEARRQVEEQKQRKLKSLRKSIEKLSRLDPFALQPKKDADE